MVGRLEAIDEGGRLFPRNSGFTKAVECSFLFVGPVPHGLVSGLWFEPLLSELSFGIDDGCNFDSIVIILEFKVGFTSS